MAKKAMTGEGAALMKVEGSGRLPGRPGAGHPAAEARQRGDHGEPGHLLAFDADID